MDDGRWCDRFEQGRHVGGRCQVRPAHLDPRAGGERLCAFAIRGYLEVGGYNSAAPAGQCGHHCGADQTECPGDENAIVIRHGGPSFPHRNRPFLDSSLYLMLEGSSLTFTEQGRTGPRIAPRTAITGWSG